MAGRKCVAQEEGSSRVLRKCEALATLRHNYVGSFSMNGTGLPWLRIYS